MKAQAIQPNVFVKLSSTVRDWTNTIVTKVKDFNQTNLASFIKAFITGMLIGALTQVAVYSAVFAVAMLTSGQLLSAFYLSLIAVSSFYVIIRLWCAIFDL